jgi:hypothetical protein
MKQNHLKRLLNYRSSPVDLTADLELHHALQRREFVTNEKGRVTIKGLDYLTFSGRQDAERFVMRLQHADKARGARR